MAREANVLGFSVFHSTLSDTSFQSMADKPVEANLLCSPPENLTETNQTLAAIDLNWEFVAGNRYQVEWKEIAQTSWSQSPIFCCRSSYTLSSLQLGKTYQWRIRSICKDQYSDWSTERVFTIACPTVTGQNEVLTPTRAQLSWNYVVNSTGNSLTYNLRWRAVGTTPWNSVTNVCCSHYTLNNLTKGKAYEWQMQAICPDSSTSVYTSPRSFTTSCDLPSYYYATEITSTSAKLYWSTAQAGAAFAIRYRPRTTPESNWTLVSGLTSSSYNLTGLTNGLLYEWQIRTLCSAEESSPFSTTGRFTTTCTTPSLYYSSVFSNQATLEWPDYGSGVRYALIYRPVTSPTSTTISNLTTTTCSLTGLTVGVAYQVQLQLICTDGNASGLSSPITFITTCNTPGYGGNNTNYGQVYWQSLGTGIHYEVQYREQGMTAWATSLTTINNQIDIPATGPQMAYEWRVRALCSGDTQSDWSSIYSLTTSACLSPSYQYEDYIEGGSVLLFFLGGSTGKSLLQWRPVGSTQWTSVTVSGINYRLNGLSSGASYEWRIQSVCSDFYSSTFSAVRTFTTYCSSPSSLGESFINNTRADVYWLAQMGLRYQVRWRQVGTTTWTNSQTGSYGYNGYAFQTLSTSLVAGTTYEWQIQSICSNDSPSGYSLSRTFTTQCTTPGFLEYKYITPNAISLVWGGPAAGLTYELRWRIQGISTWTGSATALSNSYAITGLAANTEYEIQLKTSCNSAAWSTIKTINTASSCGYPNARLMVSALDAQKIILDWGAISTVNNVNFSFRPVGTLSYTYTNGILTNPYAITGLIPNTLYVLAYDISCQAVTTSSTIYFLTPRLQACSAMYTIADGSWDNPATWSCGRVPTSNDTVEIRHAVTIPANTTGNAQRINYASGGRIIYNQQSKLIVGN